MGRITIVEGADRTGKSTLVAEFVKLGAVKKHFGPPAPGENLLQTYALALQAAENATEDTVFDRLHLGERAYGPVMRREDRIGDEGQAVLQRIINAAGAVIIVCRPPYEIAVELWRQHREHEYVKDEVKYRAIFQRFSEFVFPTWDWTGVTEVEKLPDLLRYFRTPRLFDYPVVSAGHAPKFLFVGERSSRPELDYAFIDLTGSSHFLYEALRDAGFDERECAFVNAYDSHWAVDLRGIYGRLPLGTEVVCLGGVAQVQVQAYLPAAPRSELPHPQYWKRFQNGHRDQYVQLLKDVRARVTTR